MTDFDLDSGDVYDNVKSAMSGVDVDVSGDASIEGFDNSDGNGDVYKKEDLLILEYLHDVYPALNHWIRWFLASQMGPTGTKGGEGINIRICMIYFICLFLCVYMFRYIYLFRCVWFLKCGTDWHIRARRYCMCIICVNVFCIYVCK